MSPSRTKISPTIILCLLISTLIALCYAANNNSSGKTNPNMVSSFAPSSLLFVRVSDQHEGPLFFLIKYC